MVLDVVDSLSELKEYLISKGYTAPCDVEIDCNEIGDGIQLLLDKNDWEGLRVDCCNILCELSGIRKSPQPYCITLKNYPGESISISSLRSKDNNRMVKLECVVKKVIDPVQEIMYARYRCSLCEAPIPLFRVSHDMRIPVTATCPVDDTHKKKYEVPDEHLYRDVQKITIQDVLAPRGKQPKSIDVYLPGQFVDKLSPGNRCIITGQLCTMRDKSSNYATTYIEAYYVDRTEEDYSEVIITDEDEEMIKKLSQDPDVLTHLCNSINPEIYGYNSIKLALIAQMFGGVSMEYSSGRRQRGDSHILLVGDPSMAKSQLIRSVYSIIPRGVYASGKSTSGAGLTATAVKDENDKWTLEAGAMVLSDGGMCIIDELDKMNENDRSALHEAMEQQTISINKAGMSEKLNTRCALLCAANPKEGKFIQDQELHDQIDLPPALISRFDIIFSMVDVPDKETDRKVAEHVLNIRSISDEDESVRPISYDIMRKYITYAKQYNPILTTEAKKYLEDVYVNLRLNPKSYICLRQLQANIRLSESFARIRLSNEVTIEDARRAVGLFKEALKSVTLSDVVDVSCILGVVSKEKANIERLIHELVTLKEYTVKGLIIDVSEGAPCTQAEAKKCIYGLHSIKKLKIDERNYVTWVTSVT